MNCRYTIGARDNTPIALNALEPGDFFLSNGTLYKLLEPFESNQYANDEKQRNVMNIPGGLTIETMAAGVEILQLHGGQVNISVLL